MKKFNFIIGIVILCYAVAILGFIYLIKNMDQGFNSEYKIEVNRLSYRINSDFDAKGEYIKPDLSDMKYIKKVEYSEKPDKSFFEADNQSGYEIIPLYKGNELKGYVKASYIRNIA